MESEIKQICLKCEYNLHCQNKGCAFRSLGNEYCDEVENANNLIKDLKQRIDKAIEILKLCNSQCAKETIAILGEKMEKFNIFVNEENV